MHQLIERCLVVINRTNFQMQKPFPFTVELNKTWYSLEFKNVRFQLEVETVIKTKDIYWFNGIYACSMMQFICIFT